MFDSLPKLYNSNLARKGKNTVVERRNKIKSWSPEEV
jgi:hypothetical protein